MAKQSGTRTKKKKKLTQQQIRLILAAIIIVVSVVYVMMGDPLGLLEEPAEVSAQAEQEQQVGAPDVDGTLDVYVLDVGQGDSIFMRSPSGKTMLVDTSTSSGYENLEAFLKEHNITKLDVMIVTHPHEDHIGNAYKVIQAYDIGVFYMPDVTANTRIFERMIDALDERDVDVRMAAAGDMIEWDDQVEIKVLNPIAGKEYSNMNDYSVVCRAKFGETSILLTGDAEHKANEDIVKGFPASEIASTVLKAGHHGSSTSASEEFYDAVNPSIVAISLGADNKYGHPHRETVALLTDRKIPWYRTDEHGIIHIRLDGKEAKVDTQKKHIDRYLGVENLEMSTPSCSNNLTFIPIPPA